MSTTQDTTKDMTKKSAGTPTEMELEALEAESTKPGHASTPTKPHAPVGQPDTPSKHRQQCSSKKKTRATVFITSARVGAGRTAAQRCELTEELISADAGTRGGSRLRNDAAFAGRDLEGVSDPRCYRARVLQYGQRAL